jgi:hypothetical protein
MRQSAGSYFAAKYLGEFETKFENFQGVNQYVTNFSMFALNHVCTVPVHCNRDEKNRR